MEKELIMESTTYLTQDCLRIVETIDIKILTQLNLIKLASNHISLRYHVRRTLEILQRISQWKKVYDYYLILLDTKEIELKRNRTKAIEWMLEALKNLKSSSSYLRLPQVTNSIELEMYNGPQYKILKEELDKRGLEKDCAEIIFKELDLEIITVDNSVDLALKYIETNGFRSCCSNGFVENCWSYFIQACLDLSDLKESNDLEAIGVKIDERTGEIGLTEVYEWEKLFQPISKAQKEAAFELDIGTLISYLMNMSTESLSDVELNNKGYLDKVDQNEQKARNFWKKQDFIGLQFNLDLFLNLKSTVIKRLETLVLLLISSSEEDLPSDPIVDLMKQIEIGPSSDRKKAKKELSIRVLIKFLDGKRNLLREIKNLKPKNQIEKIRKEVIPVIFQDPYVLPIVKEMLRAPGNIIQEALKKVRTDMC